LVWFIIKAQPAVPFCLFRAANLVFLLFLDPFRVFRGRNALERAPATIRAVCTVSAPGAISVLRENRDFGKKPFGFGIPVMVFAGIRY
jgi:hypothetical protein